MGGGDLNTKKSWHPSTMRNIEKVWKAEQRSEQEKKRIEELQREIKDERACEELTKFAQDQGVIEKKDDNKLTWMYQGPGGSIEHEDYLLGKRIDKTFEEVKASERYGSSATSTSADYGCIPASIFSYKGNSQIDVARKIQEDPLYLIKKKETESWSKLLNNPVKMKNLQKMVDHVSKSKKSKHSKKKKKHKRSRSSSSSSSDSSDNKISEKDLDKLLAQKYSKLRGKVDVSEIFDVKKGKDSSLKHVVGRRRSRERSLSNDDVKRKQLKEGSQYSSNSRYQERSVSSYKSSRDDGKQRFERENNRSTEKKKLSEVDREKKLREMMDNAKWREDDRTRKVSKYMEEEKKEETRHISAYNSDFLRKQLARSTDQTTVEQRVKANIYKNQRSHAAMDKSFARR